MQVPAPEGGWAVGNHHNDDGSLHVGSIQPLRSISRWLSEQMRQEIAVDGYAMNATIYDSIIRRFVETQKVETCKSEAKFSLGPNPSNHIKSFRAGQDLEGFLQSLIASSGKSSVQVCQTYLHYYRRPTSRNKSQPSVVT